MSLSLQWKPTLRPSFSIQPCAVCPFLHECLPIRRKYESGYYTHYRGFHSWHCICVVMKHFLNRSGTDVAFRLHSIHSYWMASLTQWIDNDRMKSKRIILYRKCESSHTCGKMYFFQCKLLILQAQGFHLLFIYMTFMIVLLQNVNINRNSSMMRTWQTQEIVTISLGLFNYDFFFGCRMYDILVQLNDVRSKTAMYEPINAVICHFNIPA